MTLPEMISGFLRAMNAHGMTDKMWEYDLHKIVKVACDEERELCILKAEVVALVNRGNSKERAALEIIELIKDGACGG